MGRLILVSVASILLFTAVCLARTWFVTPDGTGDAPTIQAAVDSARGGDTVLLDDGTFTGAGNRDIVIGPKTLNIISISGHPGLCIIDCGGSPDEHHRAFSPSYEGGRLTFDGLTITNGYHVAGGAIDCNGYPGRDFVVSNCRFLENHADWGGVFCVYIDFGDYYFNNCVFMGNSATEGGVFWCLWHYTYCNLEAEDCTFIGNSADWGAVMWGDFIMAPEGGTHFTRCTLVANSSDTYLVDIVDEMRSSIIAYNQGYLSNIWAWCCDAYGNSHKSWEDAHAGRNGNFSACPSFCNAFAEPFDLHLCDESPCLPGNHPDGVDCGLIGAWPVGCSCGPSRAEGTTWGGIKAMYR